MKLALSEILGQASQLKNKKDKVEFLQKHECRPLLDIIQYAYHPQIIWDLPEGSPPYKPTEYLDQEGALYNTNTMRKLALFVNGNGNRLARTKLESLYIQLLESLMPKDAELLLMVKERKLPKGLTVAIIEEAFPGLIPNEQDQEVPQE